MPASDLALEMQAQPGETRTALRVFFLTVALLFAVVAVRALLDVVHTPLLRPVLGLLLLWLTLLLWPLTRTYGLWQGLAYTLIYSAGSALFASYALAIQAAQAAHAANRDLLTRLEDANRQLQRYAAQQERAAVTRQRAALARDLHDSVTQTIFSMTLTAQSALLLLKRQPERVSSQLDRLHDLAHSALAAMRTLVSELRPPPLAAGLAAALRQHAAQRQVTDNLTVELEVLGEPGAHLSPAEEQGLLRIAQEALNNVVKHAGVAQACIRLHRAEPLMKPAALRSACRFALLATAFSWPVSLAVDGWLLPRAAGQLDAAGLAGLGLLGHLLAMAGPAIAALILWRRHPAPAQPAWRWGRPADYLWLAVGLLALRAGSLLVGGAVEPGTLHWRSAIEPGVGVILLGSLTVGWLAGLGEEVALWGIHRARRLPSPTPQVNPRRVKAHVHLLAIAGLAVVLAACAGPSAVTPVPSAPSTARPITTATRACRT